MSKLYESPLRVYLLLGLFALWGVWAGFNLPISLFPNSAQATVWVEVPYGSLNAEQFFKDYGWKIESELEKVMVDGRKVERVVAEYYDGSVEYEVTFQWGTQPTEAFKEASIAINSLSASWPKESKDRFSVQQWNRNQGFFAASFYSDKRTLDDLHALLDPMISTYRSKIPDTSNLGLYNPSQKTVLVEVSPEKMATFRLRPTHIESAIENSLIALTGGSIQGAGESLTISIPRKSASLYDIENLPLITPKGENIALRDVAKVSLMPVPDQRIFKTSGVPSLILFANPKLGGNVKQMSDDVVKALKSLEKSVPSDVSYKVLVNPADFINSSIKSVIKEVGIAAILAVVILFIFIGSFKNVATAAIEIPISLVLAFILMRFAGMNLNLISLGGLALSAGMNVDASVVVMENIFRHFENAKSILNPQERLALVIKAVDEVKLPVIASTIASLVVFIPLIMTAGLTNAILGDLAKAVVFSHMFSAVVALLLVPTVRLHLMRKETKFHTQSPFEAGLRAMENFYLKSLKTFLQSATLRYAGYGSVVVALILLVTVVLPKLPKEIIGTPETDWIILGANSRSSTDIKQMEALFEETELRLQEKFPDSFLYTFTQIHSSNNGNIMLRLKDRIQMDTIWKSLESEFENTPLISYYVSPWNPSELPLPNPPHLKVEITGATPEARDLIAEEVRILVAESELMPRVWTLPEISKAPLIRLTPYNDVLARADGWNIGDISQYSRMATGGREIGTLTLKDKSYGVRVQMNTEYVKSIEDLKSLPIGLQNKIIPLSALAKIELAPREPSFFRVNQTSLNRVEAKLNKSELPRLAEIQKKTKALVEKWIAEELPKKEVKPTVQVVEANIELEAALEQLKWALLLSVVLIFVTMILQFGDV
ncbi:MAG: efflux RND transporter permease subunit, partial [Pseudobdellovibrionaceae bacterium]